MIVLLLTFMFAYDHTTAVQHVHFDRQDIQLQFDEGYAQVRVTGCEITDEPGAPELPVKAVMVALPLGAKITGITILDTETEFLDGEHLLACAQPPVILSQDEITQRAEPDENIYASDQPYPENIIELRGEGIYGDYQICELLVYPLQYKPKSMKLIYHRSVSFRIMYEGGSKRSAQSTALKKMVINPDDVTITKTYRTRDNFTYLIISDPPVDTVFQRLADWKTKKGVPTQVRTVNWILANYSGEDNAACIRNYIKTLPDSNIQYVLLAGDTYMIPCRYAYAMTCSAFIWNREDSLPCDLYYADLQGDWNFDGDGLYGEIEDSIDLYPDLTVGRAPVGSIAEAQSYVNKILTYEKDPPREYLDNALLLAEILWSNPYTNQGIHKDRLEAESFPPNLYVTKLYEAMGNETRTAVMNALRNGQNLINHDGHGSTSVMGVGTGYLNYNDLDTITTNQQYGILFSLGCWTAAFDFSSIGEAFVKNIGGGGIAFVGNSSYGWGSPGNPGFGISDIFDSRFFYSLLVEENYHIGTALSMCKAHFIPYSREKNVYRWHQYQLNLLGDPEMMVWTAIPESLIVAAPQSIPLGNSSILFAVQDKNTGTPVENALVCLMKGSESYASGYTDASGQVFLDANPASMGNCDLTVTAHNYIPLETTIPVVTGPFVNYQGWIINDSLGNADGIANPNEIILLSLILKNDGNAVANNINITLRTQDPNATIGDSTEYLSVLNAADSTCLDNAFSINIGNTTNAHTISFELEVDEATRTLTYYPGLLVGTPILSIADFTIYDPPTMPGDTASIYLDIANSGYGYAHTPCITLSSADPYVTLLTDSISPPDIPPGTTQTVGPFGAVVSQGCPAGHHPLLSFVMSAESYAFNEDLVLLVGETGFTDDMEYGSGLWTTGGQNNLWHLSTRRAFSAVHSWYCGHESSGLYSNNMDCYIQTIPFMANHNSRLRFMRWFEVPIYGSDGIYVIIVHADGSDTLDFIGTGGALGGGRELQGDWFEQDYSLAQYSGGDTIQIRISFKSDYDGDVAEGFYIDDVNVLRITAIEEYVNDAIHPLTLHIYPTPFRNLTNIRYTIHDPGSMTGETNQSISGSAGKVTEEQKPEMKIYDATGRLVKSFSLPTAQSSNSTSVIWDGHDDNGRMLSPGIYFVRLEMSDHSLCEKVVLVR